MSDSPFGATPAGPGTWPPPPFPSPKPPSRWPIMVAIALAAAALGVALGSWFRPAPEPAPVAAPVFTDSQVADAKKQVCDAFQLARNAIVTAGNKDRGTDPTFTLAMVANARLAFIGGGQYLIEILNQNEATPAALADAVRQYSSSFQQLGLGLLADTAPEHMDQAMLKAGETANDTIKQICQ